MNSVGTATQAITERPRLLPRSLILCLAVMALAVEIIHWWQNGGQEQLLLVLQPNFTVTQVDSQAKTVTLSRVQESWIANCDRWCDVFAVGKKYPMFNRGSLLEYRRNGQKITLPVLREHVNFGTPPGGHG